ncbi:MAG: hypothetical protein FWF35_02495 [Elusimicrobia bacterium]|nr:hypothetical protein [Elusimicrobiota bacterium]
MNTLKTYKRADIIFQIILFLLFGAIWGLLFGLNSDTYRIFGDNIYQNTIFFGRGLVPSPDFINPYANPLSDIIQYVFYSLAGARPVLVTALWGMFSGLLMFVMFRTFLLFFDKNKYFYSAVSVFLFISFLPAQNYTGAFSSPFLPLMLIFLSLFIMLRYLKKGTFRNFAVVCGLLCGAALGLDRVFWVFFIGQTAAVYYISEKKKDAAALFILCAAGGFIAASGAWLFFLIKNAVPFSALKWLFTMPGTYSGENYLILFSIIIFFSAAAWIYAFVTANKPLGTSVPFKMFGIILSFLYAGYLFFYFYKGMKENLLDYQVVLFSLGAPVLTASTVVLRDKLRHALLGVFCMGLFFYSPPVYNRRSVPPALSTLYYGGEVEKNSLVIVEKNRQYPEINETQLFPHLSKEGVLFVSAENKKYRNIGVLKNYENIYFLTEQRFPEELLGSPISQLKGLSGFPKNLKLASCAAIITPLSISYRFYPSICRLYQSAQQQSYWGHYKYYQ